MLRIPRPWLPFITSLGVAATAFAVHATHRATSPQTSTPVLEASSPALDCRRWQTKQRIAEDVAAGNRTLLEAAAAFRQIDADGAPYPREVVTSWDRRSADECYCRMVIGWVKGLTSPDRADDSTCPLEAELDARLRDGMLHLREEGSDP